MTNPITSPVASIASKAPIAQPKPSRVKDAAQQFEALMIGQMLRSVREAAKDSDSDSSGDTMIDLADQQFSKLMSQNGGLGLAQMIVKGLNHENRQQHPESKPVAASGTSGAGQSGIR
jgi:peptidoglycan hydrolase FlgJ